MCNDSYPIPILSPFFLYHPYIPYFLIQRIFHFLVNFAMTTGSKGRGQGKDGLTVQCFLH